MTLPEQNTRYVYAGPYAIGDTAPIPFSYTEPEHVKVARNDQDLEINVGYSVLGQNITLKVAVGAAETITIYRRTPLDNNAEFPQEAPFDSEKINDSIDKLTMQQQEQEEQIKRAIKLPINAPTDIENLTVPLPDPGKALKWNLEGTGLINSTYDPDLMVDEARKAAEDAKHYAESIEGVGEEAEEAKQAAENAKLYATWASRWAVGSPTEPTQGSAKFWAEQANAVVIQGFSYFTQEEWDALSTEQKEGILLALVKGE